MVLCMFLIQVEAWWAVDGRHLAIERISAVRIWLIKSSVSSLGWRVSVFSCRIQGLGEVEF